MSRVPLAAPSAFALFLQGEHSFQQVFVPMFYLSLQTSSASKYKNLEHLLMLSNPDDYSTSLQKTRCTELIISMTFSYSVCNICGIMAHDFVSISEESLKT